MFVQGITGVHDPDPTEPQAEHSPTLWAYWSPPALTIRVQALSSPAEGSGSRSWGSAEVQALACLPSPSHRKSSSLVHTSPGAAPGACCGEEAPVRAQLLLSQLHQQPCFPGSTLTLLTAKLKPSSLIQRAFPVPHPYTPLHALYSINTHYPDTAYSSWPNTVTSYTPHPKTKL